ncbi:exopolyphosphatase, partial [Actinoplanes sp. NPDC051633]|uniref:exopolyphosphatase n=1 Tax=Actinoplanes sp. NPDC051633 TaxID=3155670 RepID=UPI00343092FB
MKYRLVTRSDFDGLVCAVLLRVMDMIDDITFVHPKDVQDGAVEITDRDILTNLPYDPRAYMVFDHHHSETLRNRGGLANHVIDAAAPSAARVIYEHFGGIERFPDISAELMRAVDQADSADYTLDDILRPEGWTLLNFLMDSRTGLGRFREFRISNYQLMMLLIDACIEHQDVQDILALPDVAERADLYRDCSAMFVEQLKRVSHVEGDVVVVDLRDEETIHAGNRFMVYALYPEARVSVHVIWGRQKLNTVFACGKSILDRTSPVDIGEVMLRYGGGGHLAA